jgi:hypothetical protein
LSGEPSGHQPALPELAACNLDPAFGSEAARLRARQPPSTPGEVRRSTSSIFRPVRIAIAPSSACCNRPNVEVRPIGVETLFAEDVQHRTVKIEESNIERIFDLQSHA